MRRVATALVAIVAALLLAAPAVAAPPPVHASAYLVEDARTGEVLASSNAHAHQGPTTGMTLLAVNGPMRFRSTSTVPQGSGDSVGTKRSRHWVMEASQRLRGARRGP